MIANLRNPPIPTLNNAVNTEGQRRSKINVITEYSRANTTFTLTNHRPLMVTAKPSQLVDLKFNQWELTLRTSEQMLSLSSGLRTNLMLGICVPFCGCGRRFHSF
jgi:hypothetical protein